MKVEFTEEINRVQEEFKEFEKRINNIITGAIREIEGVTKDFTYIKPFDGRIVIDDKSHIEQTNANMIEMESLMMGFVINVLKDRHINPIQLSTMVKLSEILLKHNKVNKSISNTIDT